MKNWLKNKIARSYELLGKISRQRQALVNTVVVLTYHGVIPSDMIYNGRHLFEYRNVVTTEEFDRQMAHLKKYYTPISVNDFQNLPGQNTDKPYVVVTFDDGFENNYLYAFPILKKHGITGHFFLTTNFMGSRKFLWTEEVTYRVLHARSSALTLHINGESIQISLSSEKRREAASIALRKQLKLQSRRVIEEALEELRKATPELNSVELPRARYQFMSWEQAREMHREGMVLGSHTMDHFLLNNLNEQEVRETLSRSKQQLEMELKAPCTVFSYPNGERENFSQRDEKILDELGFRYAFTQIPGFNPVHALTNKKFDIYRINISHFMTGPVFHAVIAGLWKY